MSLDRTLSSQERDFLRILEGLEARRIASGDFDSFLELQDVCQEIGITATQGRTLTQQLARKRYLILDRTTGVDLITSKIASIIKFLFYTTTRVRRSFVRDVSDLKYLRFVKQTPEFIIPLNLTTEGMNTREQLFESLDLNQGPSRNVIDSGIVSLAERYPKISKFQFYATNEILQLLSKKKSTQSLVLVAETGAGKSLAYQLPLLLWILKKKLRAYFTTKDAINCSAILVFPRKVLAKDQYDSIMSIVERLNRAFDKLKLPTDLSSLLKIKVGGDFGGVYLDKRTKIYQSAPDIIITNPDTLKKRIMNPLCTTVYKKGVDLVLYDEVHLYYGLFGANIASLNARLQNLLPSSPVFIGMSATIAKPQKHCQKLFSIKELPDIITDRDDTLRNFTLEHHVIIKPRSGRSSLGVCIDTMSCLLHNRREDLMQNHQLGNEMRNKSLCFVDSLDLTGRWESYQRNYELFYVYNAVRTGFQRRYPIHYTPLASQDDGQRATCDDCKSGRDIMINICPLYSAGQCWWFSQDDASHGRWRTLFDRVTPEDNIRVKRLTSQEVNLFELEDIYRLFTRQNFYQYLTLPIDALIATSVLEVGVDFQRIKDIIMYGEIRAPSSYKQKAGRGAREGNLDDGLFIMTVIPPSPLAQFYYRHFQRLVYPSLAPIPLEPRNPDIIRSHAFCAVFDFLAINNIDIYNVIAAKKDSKQVEAQFDQACSFLHKKRAVLKRFVLSFLRRLGITPTLANEIAESAFNHALKTLEYLSSTYDVDGEKKKIILWVFEAFRNRGIMTALEDDFNENREARERDLTAIVDTREAFSQSSKHLCSILSRLGNRYEMETKKIQQLLLKLEGTI